MGNTPSGPSDSINSLGLSILDIGGDPRYLGLSVLGFLLLFALVRRYRHGVFPEASDWLRAGLALLATFSGILTSAIFLMTKPPAYDRLSPDMQAILGVVTVVVFMGFALKEMKEIFSTKAPAPEKDPKVASAVASAPAAVASQTVKNRP